MGSPDYTGALDEEADFVEDSNFRRFRLEHCTEHRYFLSPDRRECRRNLEERYERKLRCMVKKRKGIPEMTRLIKTLNAPLGRKRIEHRDNSTPADSLPEDCTEMAPELENLKNLQSQKQMERQDNLAAADSTLADNCAENAPELRKLNDPSDKKQALHMDNFTATDTHSENRTKMTPKFKILNDLLSIIGIKRQAQHRDKSTTTDSLTENCTVIHTLTEEPNIISLKRKRVPKQLLSPFQRNKRKKRRQRLWRRIVQVFRCSSSHNKLLKKSHKVSNSCVI